MKIVVVRRNTAVASLEESERFANVLAVAQGPSGSEISLVYEDDEGDSVTVSSHDELAEGLRVAREENREALVLRVVEDQGGTTLSRSSSDSSFVLIDEFGELISPEDDADAASQAEDDRQPKQPPHERLMWIPQEEYPDSNFIGMILGPRGSTLKRLEQESGCKISIRGNGARRSLVQSGGVKNPGADNSGDKPLHMFISAPDDAKLQHAITLIGPMLEPPQPKRVCTQQLEMSDVEMVEKPTDVVDAPPPLQAIVEDPFADLLGELPPPRYDPPLDDPDPFRFFAEDNSDILPPALVAVEPEKPAAEEVAREVTAAAAATSAIDNEAEASAVNHIADPVKEGYVQLTNGEAHLPQTVEPEEVKEEVKAPSPPAAASSGGMRLHDEIALHDAVCARLRAGVPLSQVAAEFSLPDVSAFAPTLEAEAAEAAARERLVQHSGKKLKKEKKKEKHAKKQQKKAAKRAAKAARKQQKQTGADLPDPSTVDCSFWVKEEEKRAAAPAPPGLTQRKTVSQHTQQTQTQAQTEQQGQGQGQQGRQDQRQGKPDKNELKALWADFMADDGVQRELPNATLIALAHLEGSPHDLMGALNAVFTQCDAMAQTAFIRRTRPHMAGVVDRVAGWVPTLLQLGGHTCVLIMPNVLNALPRLFDGGRDLDINLDHLLEAHKASPDAGPVADAVTAIAHQQGDTAPVIHARVVCDMCGTSPIVGVRFKCIECADFDLCAKCEEHMEDEDEAERMLRERQLNEHRPKHALLKMRAAAPRWWSRDFARNASRGARGFAALPPPAMPTRDERSRGFGGGRCRRGPQQPPMQPHGLAPFPPMPPMPAMPPMGPPPPGLWPRVPSGPFQRAPQNANANASANAGGGNWWRQQPPQQVPLQRAASREVGRPRADFVRDVTIADRSVCRPSVRLTKTWQLINAGSVAWPRDTVLVHVQGDLLHLPDMEFPVAACQPGAKCDVSVAFTTPATPGRFVAYYRLKEPQASGGKLFGEKVWVDFFVEAPEQIEQEKENEQGKETDDRWTFIQGCDSYGNDIMRVDASHGVENLKKLCLKVGGVAFNTHGCIKKSLNPHYVPKHCLKAPGRGLYVFETHAKNITRGSYEPVVMDDGLWTYYPYSDFAGSDICKHNMAKFSLEELKAECIRRGGACFNTNGWIKHTFDGRVTHHDSLTRPGKGLYVLNKELLLQQEEARNTEVAIASDDTPPALVAVPPVLVAANAPDSDNVASEELVNDDAPPALADDDAVDAEVNDVTEDVEMPTLVNSEATDVEMPALVDSEVPPAPTGDNLAAMIGPISPLSGTEVPAPPSPPAAMLDSVMSINTLTSPHRDEVKSDILEENAIEPSAPPAPEKSAAQVAEDAGVKVLIGMGFSNEQLNRFMLQKYENDVQKVVDWLLAHV